MSHIAAVLADVSVVVICEYCCFVVVSVSRLQTTGEQLVLLLYIGNHVLFLPGMDAACMQRVRCAWSSWPCQQCQATVLCCAYVFDFFARSVCVSEKTKT